MEYKPWSAIYAENHPAGGDGTASLNAWMQEVDKVVLQVLTQMKGSSAQELETKLAAREVQIDEMLKKQKDEMEAILEKAKKEKPVGKATQQKGDEEEDPLLHTA